MYRNQEKIVVSYVILNLVMRMKVRTINFEKRKGIKLYEQIYHKLEEDILEGYLKQGDQLPSIRHAIDLFHVSKTCVEKAYGVLEMKGLIKSIAQKGYFVDVDKEHVILRKQVKEHVSEVLEEEIRYDFRSQSMDIHAFDITLWKKYLRDVLDQSKDITTYGEAKGERALRVALTNYSYAMRGVLCDERKILIGSSFQSLLYILLGLLQRPCVFGMEEDGFLPAQMVCEDYEIPVRHIAKDKEGICVDELAKSDVNVVYINSVAGGTQHQQLSRSRQKELLIWAQKHHAYIIEDDHNGELRYQSKVKSSMQGFDGGKHVLYIGSFSRLLLPALRISYLVLNEELVKRYERRSEYYTPTASKMEQLALAHYISDGHLERHVKKLKKHYASKSNLMLACLQHYFPCAQIRIEESALRYVVSFKETLDIDAYVQEVRRQHIRISSTSHDEIVLSFAAIQEEQMDQAICELYTIYQAYVDQ